MTHALSPSPLHVAIIAGGHVDDDYTGAAIWTDLDSTGEHWAALVADQESAETLAENCGGSLASCDPWDGSPFGDENIGSVESPEPGLLSGGHQEFLGQLPDGWRAV